MCLILHISEILFFFSIFFFDFSVDFHAHHGVQTHHRETESHAVLTEAARRPGMAGCLLAR